MAQARGPGSRALPPAGDVGAIRARVPPVLDLAAERRVAVGAQAGLQCSGRDHRPRRPGPDQVAHRRHRERRPRHRRPASALAARRSAARAAARRRSTQRSLIAPLHAAHAGGQLRCRRAPPRTRAPRRRRQHRAVAGAPGQPAVRTATPRRGARPAPARRSATTCAAVTGALTRAEAPARPAGAGAAAPALANATYSAGQDGCRSRPGAASTATPAASSTAPAPAPPHAAPAARASASARTAPAGARSFATAGHAHERRGHQHRCGQRLAHSPRSLGCVAPGSSWPRSPDRARARRPGRAAPAPRGPRAIDASSSRRIRKVAIASTSFIRLRRRRSDSVPSASMYARCSASFSASSSTPSPRTASVRMIGTCHPSCGPERQHALDLPDHRVGQRMVGLVDDDHVGDLHHARP